MTKGKIQVSTYLKITLIFSLLLMATTKTNASECTVGEHTESISSSNLNESRVVDIVLPETYCDKPDATYPVLYLIDGNFNKEWAGGLLDIMTGKSNFIPEIILVSIRDKGTNTYRKYMTPQINEVQSKALDPASKFTHFITDELKPFIDKQYSTSDLSILYGHSMGGLFALNSLIAAKGEFDVVIASSPSLWIHNYGYVDYLIDNLTDSDLTNTSLYLSKGDETRMGIHGLVDKLDKPPFSNQKWSFTSYLDENHGSVAPVAMRHALKDYFEGWFMPERELGGEMPAEQLLSHYIDLQQQWKLNQPIPESSIRGMMRYFYSQQKQDEIDGFVNSAKALLPASELNFITTQASYAGHFESPEKALEILQSVKSNYARSSEYMLALGKAYQVVGNKAEAKSAYSTALSIAQSQKADSWLLAILQENIRLTEQ